MNKGSVVVEMEGTADNTTGVDMILTLRIAPLTQNIEQQRVKSQTCKSVRKKNKIKNPFLTRSRATKQK